MSYRSDLMEIHHNSGDDPVRRIDVTQRDPERLYYVIEYARHGALNFPDPEVRDAVYAIMCLNGGRIDAAVEAILAAHPSAWR